MYKRLRLAPADKFNYTRVCQQIDGQSDAERSVTVCSERTETSVSVSVASGQQLILCTGCRLKELRVAMDTLKFGRESEQEDVGPLSLSVLAQPVTAVLPSLSSASCESYVVCAWCFLPDFQSGVRCAASG